MSEVTLTPSGPPETVIAPEPPAVRKALADAAAGDQAQQRAAVAAVVVASPRSLEAWACLGDASVEVVDRYAAYRIGYHRGLDTLRANGWRGSGYVRWTHESNRAFLRSLAGLHRTATEIGEHDEAERCGQFLRQLDPDWPPAEMR